MPRIVFWNVSSQSSIPAESDMDNVALLSGFSPSLFKLLSTNKLEESPTPYQILRTTIDCDMYNKIH